MGYTKSRAVLIFSNVVAKGEVSDRLIKRRIFVPNSRYAAVVCRDWTTHNESGAKAGVSSDLLQDIVHVLWEVVDRAAFD